MLNFRRLRADVLADLGPLYHEYSFFGVHNQQTKGHYSPNQQAKAPILTAYVAWAIAKVKAKQTGASFAELFCADGYYAMVASRLGADPCYGIDNDFSGHGYGQKVEAIAKRLSIKNVSFINQDVNQLEKLPKVDIVANVGGLYHVTNPEEILAKSYQLAKHYLIVQTVVSLANKSPTYFESPAPGWTWGSRFSRAAFESLIKRRRYTIVDSYFNELPGNDRPEDRGSLYYLIAK